MRIALLILHADPARGGAERYTIDLAKALSARGHDVALLAGSFARDLDAGDATLTKVAAAGATRTGRYMRYVRSVREALAADRPGVVHAMLPVPPGLCDVYHPHAGIEARANRAHLSFTNPRRAMFIRVERRLLGGERPPLVLTLSRRVGRELRRFHPAFPHDRERRLFNAVDLDVFRPDGATVERSTLGQRRDGDLLALFVGNDWERKGLATVIAALDKLPSRVRLAVAGQDRPPRESAARELAADLKVADRVTFLGRRRDVADLYRTADVLVHHSSHDPCSLATLEALASGLPVVASRRDGATEIITNGEHGYRLFEEGDKSAQELADRVRKLLDPEDRQRMRDNCLSLRPRLSWDHHVGRLVEIYGEIRAKEPEHADV